MRFASSSYDLWRTLVFNTKAKSIVEAQSSALRLSNLSSLLSFSLLYLLIVFRKIY